MGQDKSIARVHSIESFGTVDGPGIRFIVFLQGCNLQCKYCHNRDTWNLKGGQERSLEDILKQVEKYKNYIMPEGGVTVTGGEPLLQVDFLIKFFKELKERGIHTCIDTSGMVPLTDRVKELLELTDLVLLDIKHIDSEKCKKLVGVSNKLELEFARYLSDNNIKMWIRQVIIPGYTDDEQDLLKLKEFINNLKTVEKIELLPYHSMGKYKWNRLNIKYELEDVREATQEDIDKASKLLKF